MFGSRGDQTPFGHLGSSEEKVSGEHTRLESVSFNHLLAMLFVFSGATLWCPPSNLWLDTQ